MPPAIIVIIVGRRGEMVEAKYVDFFCLMCSREFMIEPEPSYRTEEEYAEAGFSEPCPEINPDYVEQCPMCGSSRVTAQ